MANTTTLGVALICNMTSIASVIAAAVLAWDSKDGWGWFLFIALCTHVSVKVIE